MYNGVVGQPSVVVVEDHPLFLRGLVSLLEGAGLSVVATARGLHDGLEGFETHQPDGAVIDLYLDGGSGVDMIRRIRERHGDRPKLIVLTVSRDPSDMLAAVRAGADGYLTKDQSPDGLARAIRGAFDGEAAISRQMVTHLFRDARATSRPAAATASARRRLTPRQLEILQMIASGATTAEIAERLYLSPETVRWHVKAILRKLGARTRAEAAATLREVGAAPAAR